LGVSDKIDTVAARLACPWARSPAAWATASRTLVSTYVGALQGDDVAANELIDAAYSLFPTSGRLL
jgi:hypothetical protein